MRTRHAGQAVARPTGAVRARLAPFSGVVVLLAGLGFLLTPGTPAGAAPPSQGYTATEAPLPNDANANPNVYTATTTCPVPNGCVVVGWYSDTANRPWGLIEQQNGTTWTDTRAPQPNNAGSGTNQGLWLGSQQCGILGFEQLCHAVACPTATTLLCGRSVPRHGRELRAGDRNAVERHMVVYRSSAARQPAPGD